MAKSQLHAGTITIAWDACRREAWEERTSSLPRLPLQQGWTYGEAARALGGTIHRALWQDADGPLAQGQWLLRRRMAGNTQIGALAVCLQGPLWLRKRPPTSSQIMAMTAALREHHPFGRRVIPIWMPYLPPEQTQALHDAGLRQVMTPVTHGWLDLTHEAEALRRKLDSKWRNRLRAVEKSPPPITSHERIEDTTWLLTQDQIQQYQKGFLALPPSFTQAFAQAAEQQEDGSGILMLEAHYDGVPAAAQLFLLQGSFAHYHIGWNSGQGRENSLHNLLLWHAILTLKERGITVLDLGALDTLHNPGIARFKLGAGAELHTDCGSWIRKVI